MNVPAAQENRGRRLQRRGPRLKHAPLYRKSNHLRDAPAWYSRRFHRAILVTIAIRDLE